MATLERCRLLPALHIGSSSQFVLLGAGLTCGSTQSFCYRNSCCNSSRTYQSPFSSPLLVLDVFYSSVMLWSLRRGERMSVHNYNAQIVQLLQPRYHDDLQVQNYLGSFAQTMNHARDQNHIRF